MSRVHVHMVRQPDDGERVNYLVFSGDFSADRQEQIVGRVLIEPNGKEYSFFPLGLLGDKDVIPPQVWDLPKELQELSLSGEFRNHEYGALTSRIARMTKRLLKDGRYPSEAYGTT